MIIFFLVGTLFRIRLVFFLAMTYGFGYSDVTEPADSYGRPLEYTGIRDKNKLNVRYEWKQVLYAYETPEVEISDIKQGIYIPGKPFIADVDVFYPLSKYISNVEV